MHRTLIVVATAFGCAAAAAQAPEPDSVSTLPKDAVERMGLYEDSFVLLNRMRNNDWIRDDDRSIRTRFSFKYSFCGPRVGPGGKTVETGAATGDSWCPDKHPFWKQVEIFAAYTGEFDFYFGTRESGPVINRHSMPGLYGRFPLKILWSGAKDAEGAEVGLVHRSNGQVTDVVTDGGAAASVEYARGNYAYFDTISRDANFLSLAFDRRLDRGDDEIELRAKVRLYFGRQYADVTWGPYANDGRKFSDYDRFEFRAAYKLSKRGRFTGQWRIGDKGLATDSITLGLNVDLWDFPFYLRLHRGPMNTLSNYTQRQDSIGFGLLLARY